MMYIYDSIEQAIEQAIDKQGLPPILRIVSRAHKLYIRAFHDALQLLATAFSRKCCRKGVDSHHLEKLYIKA